ncbi:hypothetical protein SAMN05661030_2700 [Klenkia taihuensis]|uniref:Uncharacterized protein n=2 Tax=Klenkia taihuensis TaxID=1225127 RepID=A0A1I1QBG2_9ACTN|nr:hypothetical protein SAMN05661030_2700 [Klenkia taihuensis]
MGVLSVGVLAVVLAGAPDANRSSTLALLSDQAVVDGAAQAAVLSLDVQLDGADGQPTSPPALEDGGDVEVTVTGQLRWELSVQLLPVNGEPGCAGEAGAMNGVVLDVASGAVVRSVAKCAPAQVIGAGQGPGAHRLAVAAAEGVGTEDVLGLLRIRVAQVPGGFSDLVDVPVRLVAEDGGADEGGRSTADDPGASVGEEPVGGGGSSSPAAPPVSGASPGVETAPGPGAAPEAGTSPPPAAEEPRAAETPVGDAPPSTGSDDAGEEPPAETGTSATEEPAPDPAS